MTTTYYFKSHKFKTFAELCIFYTFDSDRFDLIPKEEQDRYIKKIIYGLTENERKVLRAIKKGDVNESN